MIFYIKTSKKNAENKLSFAKLLIAKDHLNNVMAYYIDEELGILDKKLFFMI